jgi:hypothetical protein
MRQSRFEEMLRRVRAMHKQWSQVTTDLTLDQVNHHEREGVLPIAFSLHHYVLGEDRAISQRIYSEAPIWESDGWSGRVGASVPSVTRGTPIAVAETLQFADFDAWLGYQSAVFARTEAGLQTLSDERWDDVLFERMPDQLKGGFLELVVGDGPVTLGDMLDVFICSHGVRHLGEIEHARALVGLQGVA